MLSIGEFSKICSVTTKTLRYYDEIGLLTPSSINDETGYRYYDVSQLKVLLTINRLKEYELSLDDIGAILNDGTEELLLERLQEKEQEFGIKVKEYAHLLSNLTQEIQKIKKGEKFMNHLDKLEVKLVDVTPKNILFSRQRMNIQEFEKYYGKLFERIAKEKLTCIGSVLAIYHDEEFDPNNSDIEVAVEIKEAVKGTRDLAPGLCAVIRHEGPYSELSECYAKAVSWIEKEGYVITSSPFDDYITDPSKTKPEENITEIYFPVKKK